MLMETNKQRAFFMWLLYICYLEVMGDRGTKTTWATTVDSLTLFISCDYTEVIAVCMFNSRTSWINFQAIFFCKMLIYVDHICTWNCLAWKLHQSTSFPTIRIPVNTATVSDHACVVIVDEEQLQPAAALCYFGKTVWYCNK